MMRKVLAFRLAVATTASMAACSNSTGGSSNSAASAAPQGEQSICYLNFKPEVISVYEKITKAYRKEAGVVLNVVTAAPNACERTLKPEVAKTDAPTIFQINGPRNYIGWKNYCANLKDIELYKHLTDKSLAVTDGNSVHDIPYMVEGYGTIYSQAIMDKYFKTSGTKTASMAEINSFNEPKAAVKDTTVRKDELDIKGVSFSISLKPMGNWRWWTHPASVPVYYELKDNKIDLTSDAAREIRLQYSDNFRNIFDLYLNDSTTPKNLPGTKRVTDPMAEFALGQTTIVQNDNWAWSQISGMQGNTVEAEDVEFLPIYTGAPGEENQGLCIGAENFFAISKEVLVEKQEAAEDFLY